MSSKSDEKQKSFINSLFLCSEFQSVNRIVKIVHSGCGDAGTYLNTGPISRQESRKKVL